MRVSEAVKREYHQALNGLKKHQRHDLQAAYEEYLTACALSMGQNPERCKHWERRAMQRLTALRRHLAQILSVLIVLITFSSELRAQYQYCVPCPDGNCWRPARTRQAPPPTYRQPRRTNPRADATGQAPAPRAPQADRQPSAYDPYVDRSEWRRHLADRSDADAATAKNFDTLQTATGAIARKLQALEERIEEAACKCVRDRKKPSSATDGNHAGPDDARAPSTLPDPNAAADDARSTNAGPDVADRNVRPDVAGSRPGRKPGKRPRPCPCECDECTCPVCTCPSTTTPPPTLPPAPTPLSAEPKLSHLVLIADQAADHWPRTANHLQQARSAFPRIHVVPVEHLPWRLTPLPQLVAYDTTGKPMAIDKTTRDVDLRLAALARRDFPNR